MGKRITAHGFRTSFRVWAAEATSYPGEIADAGLSHKVRNKVEAAYRRTDFLEKRREMMQRWADHCEGIDNVVKLAAKPGVKL